MWVADHGDGIPRGDYDRVLKRFVRLDTARSRPGTGLGLSLVAAVVRQHGGRVELADNLPGLKVVLRLPPARLAESMLTSGADDEEAATSAATRRNEITTAEP